ncbi:unnamed protein product [Didymodactylos carnosus]|uniref:Potassium channel tetramerisation-type BTB domain-containing protein n=1 Tax=Didymodactylos carnosus TaxID=1234261 RepID=A0A813S1Z9_9BILA|nr:unnamed protein product [Didymodactylos carnosus]CAF0791082.1 unnamed protein product [Didymodactylos carnosus]CAF3500963.1 unnamed protein product [Didymodactylos carnosus]CAF3575306.1 unnamed protein product [Didymodactylos carnosus]
MRSSTTLAGQPRNDTLNSLYNYKTLNDPSLNRYDKSHYPPSQTASRFDSHHSNASIKKTAAVSQKYPPVSSLTPRLSRLAEHNNEDSGQYGIRRLVENNPLAKEPPSNYGIRKLAENNPLARSRDDDEDTYRRYSRSPSATSLKSILIAGNWNSPTNSTTMDPNEKYRLKVLGIENLVELCHDILQKTKSAVENRHVLQSRPSSSIKRLPSARLNVFTSLKENEITALKRSEMYNLMKIFHSASYSASTIGSLVSIWREVMEHYHYARRSRNPKMTYETVIKQFSDTNQRTHLQKSQLLNLTQIMFHASMTTRSKNEIKNIFERLKRDNPVINNLLKKFDITMLKEDTVNFDEFLHLLSIIGNEHSKQQQLPRSFIEELPYRQKKKRGLIANVSGTKFNVVRKAADASGFNIGADNDFTANLLWNDTLISMDIVSQLKPYQKINHFPTMSEISRKDLLAKNFERLSRLLPEHFNFTPRTWVLPNEYNLWYSHASHHRQSKTPPAYIVKPSNGAMGHGIQVHCDIDRIQPLDNYIVQEYIQDPYLIDGYKFDLRIYALITSSDPLRVFIFNNGLVRMSTEKYEIPNKKNASHLFMHLTNYSVNKCNESYEPSGADTKTGSKRSLKYFFEYLRTNNQDSNALWKEIQNVILKTVFLAQPHLYSAYRMCRPAAAPNSESVCFEVLGFDILINKQLKPWLLEVNRCPSFGTNEQIDFDIKVKLLLDTFELLRFRISDRKKSLAIEKAEAQRRLYYNIGKRLDESLLTTTNLNNQSFKTRQKKLIEVKEKLYLMQRENAREIFENRHLNGFIRLFPVEDSVRMEELMPILTKCFEVLYSNKKDMSWNKYYDRYKEDELLATLTELEDAEKTDRKNNPRLARVPTHYDDRVSPSASFASEMSDDEFIDNDHDKQHHHPHHHHHSHHENKLKQSFESNNYTEFINKNTSSSNSLTTHITRQSSLNGSQLSNSITSTNRTMKNAFFKTRSQQTNGGITNNSLLITRSTSLSPLVLRKRVSLNTSSISTGIVTRPKPQSQTPNTIYKKSPLHKTHNSLSNRTDSEDETTITTTSISEQYHVRGTPASSIIEKHFYDEQNRRLTESITARRPSQPDNSPKTKSNQKIGLQDKANMVTYTALVNAYKKQQVNQHLDPSTFTTKDLALKEDEIVKLHQLTYEHMQQLCIRYPGKSADDTKNVCQDIIENWKLYKVQISEFWLVRLDGKKRQAIINIVSNNVKNIFKKVWIIQDIENLTISRHIAKIVQRLLVANGQCLWEACQDNDKSWKTMLIKSTNEMSPIEFLCCQRFVDLCKQALFVVYKYSIDEKEKHRKHRHINDHENIDNSLLNKYPDTLLGDKIRLSVYYRSNLNVYFFSRDPILFEKIIIPFYEENGKIKYDDFLSKKLFYDELIFYDLKKYYKINLIPDIFLRRTYKYEQYTISQDKQLNELNIMKLFRPLLIQDFILRCIINCCALLSCAISIIEIIHYRCVKRKFSFLICDIVFSLILLVSLFCEQYCARTLIQLHQNMKLNDNIQIILIAPFQSPIFVIQLLCSSITYIFTLLSYNSAGTHSTWFYLVSVGFRHILLIRLCCPEFCHIVDVLYFNRKNSIVVINSLMLFFCTIVFMCTWFGLTIQITDMTNSSTIKYIMPPSRYIYFAYHILLNVGYGDTNEQSYLSFVFIIIMTLIACPLFIIMYQKFLTQLRTTTLSVTVNTFHEFSYMDSLFDRRDRILDDKQPSRTTISTKLFPGEF